MKKLVLLQILALYGYSLIAQEVPRIPVEKSDIFLSTIANRYFSQYGNMRCKNWLDYADSLAVWNIIENKNNPHLENRKFLYADNPKYYQKSTEESGEEEAEIEVASTPQELLDFQIDTHLSTGNTTSVSMENGNNGGTRGSTGGKDSKGNKGKKSSKDTHFISWVWLLLGVLFGAVLGVFLFNVLYVKKIIEEQERRNNELSRKNQTLYREKSSESSELSRLQLKIQGLEREKGKILNENIALGEEIDRLKVAQSNTNKTRITEAHPITTSTSHVPNQPSEPSTVLYADAIIDDYFVKVRETPSEDSIFVLQLNGNNSAEFDIFKNAYSKVAANPSYLDGCEKQILYETKQIDIISKGSAQLMGLNGKWKVVKKLNVIIK